jgi:RNA polymerase sigma-70 factor (ECF subfamily)
MDFNHLYQTYYPAIHRFCFRMIYDADEAKDICQDTFVRLHQRLQYEEQIDNVRAWLYRVAGRLCLNHVQKKTRRSYFNKQLSSNSLSEGDEDRLLQRADMDSVHKALQQLKEGERMLVYMYYDDLSYNEMAAALNVKPTNVGSMLARAIQKLAKLLREDHETKMS